MLAATRHHFSTQDSSEVGRYPSTATRDLENFIIKSLASKVFSDGQSLTSWGKKIRVFTEARYDLIFVAFCCHLGF